MTGPSDGIETHDARTNCQPPFQAGFHERDTIEEEIELMLKLKIIQPNMSAWSSPVVLVPKADDSTLFCVDFRRLNELTVRDSFPLPRLDHTVDSLADATIFTTLNARAGFWQVPVYLPDIEKKRFTTRVVLTRVCLNSFRCPLDCGTQASPSNAI